MPCLFPCIKILQGRHLDHLKSSLVIADYHLLMIGCANVCYLYFLRYIRGNFHYDADGVNFEFLWSPWIENDTSNYHYL